MSEKAMRGRIIPALSSLDAVAVENGAHPGTPDVEYIGGWIELKKLADWPKRLGTIVRVRHFTPQQRVWLRRRELKGGRAHVLLQVKDEWLLFSGTIASLCLGKVPRGSLRKQAIRIWKGHEQVRCMLDSELKAILLESPCLP